MICIVGAEYGFHLQNPNLNFKQLTFLKQLGGISVHLPNIKMEPFTKFWTSSKFIFQTPTYRQADHWANNMMPSGLVQILWWNRFNWKQNWASLRSPQHWMDEVSPRMVLYPNPNQNSKWTSSPLQFAVISHLFCLCKCMPCPPSHMSGRFCGCSLDSY